MSNRFIHIIISIMIIISLHLSCISASFESSDEKKKFMQSGRKEYREHLNYHPDAQRKYDNFGGREAYAQHNAEATGGRGFEKPENLGFKVLDYGVDGFEESCIYNIVKGELNVVSAIGQMGSGSNYAVDLTLQNMINEPIQCIFDTGTVFE
eukprot:195614_1